ncbi:MAG: stage II sporulation protein R [Eubacterium sp.]|nr:stage II sporulation protein R [Eubacterium sp.]
MKTYKIFLPLFMILTLTLSLIQPIIATSEDISNKVLRLHILANSDSTEDQNIKLALKNYFLENTTDLFIGKTVEENIAIAKENTDYIENLCNQYLSDNGYDYKADVTVDKEYFDTRVYDDFTLPAGIYNSIKIEIGEGNGHNWWCIVFPSVCLSACSTSMSDYLTDEEMELINDGYTPKFKIVEIYEKIKSRLNQ